MTTVSKILGPAEGGKPRSLVLDKRLINPTTDAVAAALEAAWVTGLSLGSRETPSHLTDLSGRKDVLSTWVEIVVGSILPRLAPMPPGVGGYRGPLSCSGRP